MVEGQKVSNQWGPISGYWNRIGVNSQFHTPIPILWNWFLECPNSNSIDGMGGQLQLQNPRNWGDSKGFHMFEFPSLHPGVTSSPKKTSWHLVHTFFQLFQLISKQTSESLGIPPDSVELELELLHQFQDWNLKWGSIQFQLSGQWFELRGSYFEVKISSTKASIGDIDFENSFHWPTLV